jgi:hypothetical protein
MSSQAMKIRGGKRLQKTLQKLPRGVQSRTIRRGISGAAKEANKQLKKAAPKQPGIFPYGPYAVFQLQDKQLSKSIGRKRKSYQKTGTIFEVIGPRNDPKYFVVIRSVSTSGGRSKVQFVPITRVAALVEKYEPWARPAIDRMSSGLIRRMTEDIRKEIKAAAREARR